MRTLSRVFFLKISQVVDDVLMQVYLILTHCKKYLINGEMFYNFLITFSSFPYRIIFFLMMKEFSLHITKNENVYYKMAEVMDF